MKATDDLLDVTHRLFPVAEARVNALCSALRGKLFREIRDGTTGEVVIAPLRRYMARILQEAGKQLSRHSRYFWLYHYRRLHQILQMGFARKVDWTTANWATLRRERLAIGWYNHRLTLALLKYGHGHSMRDMQERRPRFKHTSGYSVPGKVTDEDIIDLLSAGRLIWEYESARYCLKRAGKGGKFRRQRKGNSFDVRLDAPDQRLVNLFDERVNLGSNPLFAYGSWADVSPAYYFPLPGGVYEPLHPWPRAVTAGSLRLGEDVPVVVSLVPNVAGQKPVSPWAPSALADKDAAPPWLFCWFDLEDVLGRIDLVRGGLFEKRLKRSGLDPYEPEDIVFALAALTANEIDYREGRDVFLFQVATWGYSKWSQAREKVRREILPKFVRMRCKYRNHFESDQDLNRLMSVLTDLMWKGSDWKALDILRSSPLKIILPLSMDDWVIDWTMVAQFMFDRFEVYGRWSGPFALEKGRDFEAVLVEYLRNEVPRRGGQVWWCGEGAVRRLTFRKGQSRDLDVGIIVKDWLILVEAKAFGGRRALLFAGDPEDLRDRTKMIRGAVDQVDSLSMALGSAPVGRNFSIPEGVHNIVGIVCCPFPEWIPSWDSSWWVFRDLPRVCRPEEIVEIIDRIGQGRFPTNNVVGVT